MKRLGFKIVFFGVAVCLLCGCFFFRRSYTYCNIKQETKDYFLFKEGSYWIYQDSLTNIIDSVILQKSISKFKEVQTGWEYGGHSDMIETYKNIYCHYIDDTVFYLFFQISDYDRSIHYPEYLDFENSFPVIVFNSNKQYKIFNIFAGIFQDFTLEYSIGKNIFNDVRVGGDTIKYYWAKNIGLIRYEIYDSDTTISNAYNLIRYNVSQ